MTGQERTGAAWRSVLRTAAGLLAGSLLVTGGVRQGRHALGPPEARPACGRDGAATGYLLLWAMAVVTRPVMAAMTMRARLQSGSAVRASYARPMASRSPRHHAR